MSLKERVYETAMRYHPELAAVVAGLYVAVGWMYQPAIGRTAFLTGGIVASVGALALLLSDLWTKVGGETA
jgi:hypothetical protein